MFTAKLIILWYRKILYQEKNIYKYDFNDLTIENLKDDERQLEDNNSSNLQDMVKFQFFDQLNSDNSDIDDNEINYIQQLYKYVTYYRKV